MKIKPEYKYNKQKNIITKDGHTMFLCDVILDMNYYIRKAQQKREILKKLKIKLEKNIHNGKSVGASLVLYWIEEIKNDPS